MVSIFIVSRGKSPNRILYKNVPEEIARKFCSDDRTAGKNFMAVWSREECIGLFGCKEVEDNGRFEEVWKDILEGPIEIQVWNGNTWIWEVKGGNV